MAFSYVRTIASGATAIFTAPSAYLSQSHVSVYKDGVVLVPTTDYTWPTSATIQLVAGAPTAGTVILAKRVTPTDPLVDFEPGNLSSDDLDTVAIQAMYLGQENREQGSDFDTRAWYTAALGDGGLITKGATDTVPKFDASGNLIEGPSVADVEAAQGYASSAGASATLSQAWAAGTLPGGAGTKSALEHAGDAGVAAALAAAWAEGTEPGGVGTKSAEEWATEAMTALQAQLPVFAFTGDGVTTDFPLPQAPASAQNVLLFGTGLWQIADTDYTVVGTTLTFPVAPASGVAYAGVIIAAVTTLNEVADNSVTALKLAALSVLTSKLADGAVTTIKVADEAITLEKLAVAVQALLTTGDSSEIYPVSYGVVGDNVAEDSTELTAWINAWKATDPVKDAIFGTGTYLTTSKLPSLFKAKGRMLGKGRPVIRYAGAAVSDLVEVTAVSNSYGVHVKNLGIIGNSLTTGLFLTNYVHHSTFEDIYLRDCATSASAMRTLFAVMNTYRNITVSWNNEGAFTYSPAVGVTVGAGVTAATQTIDCLFERLIIEGVTSHGLLLDNSWYNTYINGTSEGNGGWGVIIADYSRYNTFIDFFCEVNTSGDFSISGHSNVFINCEGLSTVNGCVVAGDNNVFIGGRYKDFTVSAGATGTILDNVEITGTYTDNGTGTIVR